jgi:outer membrane protein OmpA-like peptidoglycan-associated protein
VGGYAQARSGRLCAQLKDMTARKTDRGMGVTVGEMLFDTHQLQLKPGGLRNLDKVVGSLKLHPMCEVLIDGFNHSAGSNSANQQSSDRRADALRSALVEGGVPGN